MKFRVALAIQGGGAKGAWEAGVLSGILRNPKIEPLIIWGTSAGAINAIWAAQCVPDTITTTMEAKWLKLAHNIRMQAAFTFCMFIFAIFSFLGLSLWLPSLPFFIGTLYWAELSALSLMLYVHCDFRLPGLLSQETTKFLIPIDNTIPPNCIVQIVTTDANNPRYTEDGLENDSSQTFTIRTGSTQAEHNGTRTIPPKPPVTLDLQTIAAISAALPIVCRPYDMADYALIDGGVVSNLPVDGFINGDIGVSTSARDTLSSIILIIPVPLRSLSPTDMVDRKTLRSLHKLRSVSRTSKRIFPHFRDLLIVTPESKLCSGTIFGFFFPCLLRTEFYMGVQRGIQISDKILAYNNGANPDALTKSGILIQEVSDQDLPKPATKADDPFYKYWIQLGAFK